MSWEDLKDYLHEKIFAFARNKWRRPTAIQLKAIPLIYEGHNIIVSAPTGMGKTEAVMLPIMSRLLEEKGDFIEAVYVAPLRALVNNIFGRLDAIGASVGLRVAIRTGERKRLRGRILVTTPESLSAMIFGKNRDMLMNVKYIVIDEIHNLVYSDRGVYLSIIIEFLKELLPRKPQIVGISATVPDEDRELLLRFVGSENFIEVKSQEKPFFILSEALEFAISESVLCKSITELFSLDLKQYGLSGRLFPSIIFGNSRRFTEYLADLLNSCIKGEFGVIHSDVKKRFREEYIRKFEDGELTGIVATSALGEGVDFTMARGVIQVASPGHPVFLRQRIGRARHKPGETPVSGMISLSPIDMVEIVAIIGLLLEGENIGYIRAVDSFSAITKAIVNALASKFSALSKEKILEIIKRSSLITNKELTNKIWESLEKDGIILKQKESYELNMRKWRSLYRRSKEEKYGDVLSRTMRHFYTVIPFQSKYDVVIIGKKVKIGSLDPEFVSTRIRPLITFQLAGRNLRVLKIDHFNMRILVEEIDKAEKTIPFWLSPPIVRTKPIGEKMLNPEFLKNTIKRKEIIYIKDEFKKLFKQLLDEISTIAQKASEAVPIVARDTDEYFAITLFYPGGEGANRYAAYALSSLFQEVYGSWMQPELKISPISLTLIWKNNKPTSEDLINVLKNIKENNESLVKSVIGDYGRIEATLNQILDGIAMGAYRLENLDDLGWIWIEEVGYRGLLDREIGEKILQLLKQRKIAWLKESEVKLILNGIMQLPEEKMGYKAYREALKRRILEVIEASEKPLDLSELARLTGYRRSVAVLYDMLYSLIRENKVKVLYSPEGFELPAKVQILVKKYGKTKQFPVYLPGKLLYTKGEMGVAQQNEIPIEPELIEFVVKADLENAEKIWSGIKQYLEKEARKLYEKIMSQTQSISDIDLFENVPKIKIIVEIPVPKALIRKDIKKLDNIEDPWKEITKYRNMDK